MPPYTPNKPLTDTLPPQGQEIDTYNQSIRQTAAACSASDGEEKRTPGECFNGFSRRELLNFIIQIGREFRGIEMGREGRE